MISTGIAGTPFQSYSPKRASRIFVKTLARQGPPIARDPRHLHREVGLDRGGEIGGPGLEEAPAAVRELPLAQVGDGLALALGVDPVEEMAEQQELRRDGGVGFQLADPLPVGGLSTEER